jgi:hypothetical protein
LSIAKADIPMIIINSFFDLDEAYRFTNGSHEMRRFQTVCVDSISEIAEKLLGDEKARNKDARKAYGEMQDAIWTYVRLFRDLVGKNVYMTAKTIIRTNSDGTSIAGAMLPGQNLGPGLPYFFDEFFYMGIEHLPPPQVGTYRFLRTMQDNQFEAKDRSGALSPIEEPNLTKVFNKIRAAFHVGVPPPPPPPPR